MHVAIFSFDFETLLHPILNIVEIQLKQLAVLNILDRPFPIMTFSLITLGFVLHDFGLPRSLIDGIKARLFLQNAAVVGFFDLPLLFIKLYYLILTFILAALRYFLGNCSLTKGNVGLFVLSSNNLPQLNEILALNVGGCSVQLLNL